MAVIVVLWVDVDLIDAVSLEEVVEVPGPLAAPHDYPQVYRPASLLMRCAAMISQLNWHHSKWLSEATLPSAETIQEIPFSTLLKPTQHAMDVHLQHSS